MIQKFLNALLLHQKLIYARTRKDIHQSFHFSSIISSHYCKTRKLFNLLFLIVQISQKHRKSKCSSDTFNFHPGCKLVIQFLTILIQLFIMHFPKSKRHLNHPHQPQQYTFP